MICQAFTAATSVSACLWTFLPSVLSSETEYYDWDKVSDLAWRIFNFLTVTKSWLSFTVCLGSLSICTKCCPVSFVVFDWMWALSRDKNPFAWSANCRIISIQQWVCSIGSHPSPSHNTASTMFATWCNTLWIMNFFSILFYYHYFYESVLGFICIKNLNIGCFLFKKMSVSKIQSSFLLLNFTSSVHLVVKPLYLHLWRWLLTVDFGNDTTTFSRV